MRIGIDARFSRSPGVSRYYTSLIKHLARIDQTNEYLVFYPSPIAIERYHPRQENFRAVLVAAESYELSEQIRLCYQLWKEKLTVFHSTNSWVVPLVPACPLVVTVHDLIPKTHPELITRKARLYSYLMVPYSVWAASRILTVSRYSRDILLKYYPSAAGKTIVTYNGSDLDFESSRDVEPRASTLERYGLRGEFILFVGALMAHKNILRLVQAYNALEPSIQDRYALVIVGRLVPGHDDYVRSVLDAIGSNKRIFLIHYVEEPDLPIVYESATAFVFPSLQEGFGIPLVEAMSASLPVVAGNGTVIPEICAEAAVYIDAYSVESLRDGIARMLSEPGLRERLSKRAKEQSKVFSWEASARRTLRVYEELGGQKTVPESTEHD